MIGVNVPRGRPNAKQQAAHITPTRIQSLPIDCYVQGEPADKPYKCTICGYSCDRRDDMMKHVDSHTGEKTYKCFICDYSSGHLSTFYDHIKSKHPGIHLFYLFKCNVCNKVFVTEIQLRQHLRLHMQDSPREANTARKVRRQPPHGAEGLSADVPLLLFHRKRQCDVCNKLFETEAQLSRHLRESHIRISSSKDTNKCTVCDYSTAKRSNLIRHLRKHVEEEEKHPKCKVCTYRSRDPSDYCFHMKAKHPDYNPIKCTVCDQSFLTTSQLRRHLRLHINLAGNHPSDNNNGLGSPLSHSTTEQPLPLDSESIEKIPWEESPTQLQCDVCDKQFDTEVKLSRHLWEVHIGVVHSDCTEPAEELKHHQQAVLPNQRSRVQGQADPVLNEIKHQQHNILSDEGPGGPNCDPTGSPLRNDKIRYASQLDHDRNGPLLPLHTESLERIPIEDVPTDLKCDVCRKLFDTEEKLSNHLWEDHIGIGHSDTDEIEICGVDPAPQNFNDQQQTNVSDEIIKDQPPPPTRVVLKEIGHHQQTVLREQNCQSPNCDSPVLINIKRQQQTVAPDRDSQSHNSSVPVLKETKHGHETLTGYADQVSQSPNCDVNAPEQIKYHQVIIMTDQVLQSQACTAPVPPVITHQQLVAVLPYQVLQNQNCGTATLDVNKLPQQSVQLHQVSPVQISSAPISGGIEHPQQPVLRSMLSQTQTCAVPVLQVITQQEQTALPYRVFQTHSFSDPVEEVVTHQQQTVVIPSHFSQTRQASSVKTIKVHEQAVLPPPPSQCSSSSIRAAPVLKVNTHQQGIIVPAQASRYMVPISVKSPSHRMEDREPHTVKCNHCNSSVCRTRIVRDTRRLARKAEHKLGVHERASNSK